MVDAFAVFVVDRLIVFVASGDVVADPDFRLTAFGFDQTDGFAHQAVQRKAGQDRCSGRDLFFNAFAVEYGIRIRHMIVNSYICKIIYIIIGICALFSSTYAVIDCQNYCNNNEEEQKQTLLQLLTPQNE